MVRYIYLWFSLTLLWKARFYIKMCLSSKSRLTTIREIHLTLSHKVHWVKPWTTFGRWFGSRDALSSLCSPGYRLNMSTHLNGLLDIDFSLPLFQDNNYHLCQRYWPEEGSEKYNIFEVRLLHPFKLVLMATISWDLSGLLNDVQITIYNSWNAFFSFDNKVQNKKP